MDPKKVWHLKSIVNINLRSSITFIDWDIAGVAQWLMIAFNTCNSKSLPLLEGLCKKEGPEGFSVIHPSPQLSGEERST